MIIVDASVAVKWVVSEAGSPQAATLLDGRRMAAPALWLSEASNALWAKAMRGQLTPDEAREQAADLADAPVRRTVGFTRRRPGIPLWPIGSGCSAAEGDSAAARGHHPPRASQAST